MSERFAAGTTAALLALGLWTASASAADFRLEVPVDCDMSGECSIQKYVDHEPGPGYKDHTCGHLANDNHDGIDFRVRTVKDMEAGVAVIAAAPGVVKALRDGVPDISIRDGGQAAIRGREAGNGVVIAHGDGWETQYSHLKEGSIRVKIGDKVDTGGQLGEIGLSGNTEYPHVHFSVRRWNQTIDPFTGRKPGRGCGIEGESLWSEAAQSELEYRSGGLLDAGFVTDRPPDIKAVRAGLDSPSEASTDAPVLVFFAYVWGVQKGDRETMTIAYNGEQTLVELKEVIPSDKADWLRYTGRKRPAGGWAPGSYVADYKVEREERGQWREIIAVQQEIEIR